jgi:hypothetical protein
MFRFLLIPALMLTPTVASFAATPAKPAPEKVSTLVVYGNDPCPKGDGNEVVVCARQPESERYRIPHRLREKPYNAARDGSWAGTAAVVDAAGRQNMPGACNANGAWGQTGCWDRFMAEARADREAQAKAKQNQDPE